LLCFPALTLRCEPKASLEGSVSDWIPPSRLFFEKRLRMRERLNSQLAL
jgi:hypothetical protein